jgi:benzoyl-CoA reductase/2-hydroxyglutaryl-CoA dehydratase subunit BcrC/BadD/HgdB
MEKKLKWIRRGLRTGFLYDLGKIGVRMRVKGYMKDALIYFLDETRAAFRKERPVIWCSTFVPGELIYALGGVPFMPEVASGFAAAVGIADHVLLDAEGDWFHADLCSIHRCGTGLMMSGLLPEPDLIISSSHLCDGARKYLQYISYKYNCPYYLLEVPYQQEDADWLAGQIERMVTGLIKEKIIKEVDFATAFSLSNQAYQEHQRVNQLRKSRPACFSGEGVMNLVPMEFMSFGSRSGVDFYRTLADMLEERVRNQEGVLSGEKYRLLWLHLKPYYPQRIFADLRERGAVIAFEEYSQLYWSPLDINNPYHTLARKMINHFGWGPLSVQLERIRRIIEEYSIDGVIGFSQWGCRQSSGRMGIIKQDLQKQGIPFLNLDGDLIDSRNYREGQLLNRLEAFLELLEERKGCSRC